MSRNSEHLSSFYNSNIRLRSELSEYRLWVSNVINGEIAVLILEMLLKNGQRTKVDAEGWAGGRRESRDILSRINLIPLGGVNMFLILRDFCKKTSLPLSNSSSACTIYFISSYNLPGFLTGGSGL